MSDPTDYSLEIFRLLGINSKIVSARNEDYLLGMRLVTGIK